MNWEDLAAKKVPAPFKPVIRDALDVSNFAEEFTEMDPTYSPAALPQNCDRIFQVGECVVIQPNCVSVCVLGLLALLFDYKDISLFPLSGCFMGTFKFDVV